MITHLRNPNSNNSIVFVHGLGGGRSTWANFANYLNEKWSEEVGFILHYFSYYRNIPEQEHVLDCAKGKIFIFLLKALLAIPYCLFFLFKVLWSKRNSHNVKLLDKYIQTHCNDSKNIILVAHSMGGLIARQYLINCRRRSLSIGRIRLLITYATPHIGSKRANMFNIRNIPLINIIYDKASTFFEYRLSPQVGDLITVSEFITKINYDWTSFGLERKVKFMRIVASNDRLVERQSAILHENDFGQIHEYPYGHRSIINPAKGVLEFPPVDILITALQGIDFDLEPVEEDETDPDLTNDSEDIESY